MKIHASSLSGLARIVLQSGPMVFLLMVCPFQAAAQTTPSLDLAATPTPEPTGPQPELHVFPTSIDLGTIKEGKTTSFTVEVSNKGKSVLNIYGLRTSCGCTNVSIDNREIAPGGVAHIGGYLKTINYPGPQLKTITISSNDPKTPELLISLRAEVIPIPASGFYKIPTGPTGKLQVTKMDMPTTLALEELKYKGKAEWKTSGSIGGL
jgi:hypothetical protein